MTRPVFLCIASYFKGGDFLRQAHAEGVKVILLTDHKLQHEAWPFDAIDDTIYMESDESGNWNMEHLINGLAYRMRSEAIDRIIALDDFDVEKAAALREHFRIPGMGQTTHRYFRDKLAMRIRAAEAGIRVPAFSPLFNDAQVQQYIDTVAPPWVVKPRAEASATGIKKVHSAEALWPLLHELGDERHLFLIEQFRPGTVYHVDALTVDGTVAFARGSQYLDTPMEVAHGGGIFRTVTVEHGSAVDHALQAINADLLAAFGMQYSATHAEFIQSDEDGQMYFLEVASRVGGAHIAEQLEASSGINIWREWAKLELAKLQGTTYTLPPARDDYAGLIISLARQEHPDMSVFSDPEVCWHISKSYHVGVIVQSSDRSRILTLLDAYAQRIAQDFHAALPAADKPTS